MIDRDPIDCIPEATLQAIRSGDPLEIDSFLREYAGQVMETERLRWDRVALVEALKAVKLAMYALDDGKGYSTRARAAIDARRNLKAAVRHLDSVLWPGTKPAIPPMPEEYEA